MHLSNAPTGLMKGEGYGAGYRYLHDDSAEGMNDCYLPGEMGERVYYEPRDRGEEAEIKDRIERWRRDRDAREGQG